MLNTNLKTDNRNSLLESQNKSHEKTDLRDQITKTTPLNENQFIDLKKMLSSLQTTQNQNIDQFINASHQEAPYQAISQLLQKCDSWTADQVSKNFYTLTNISDKMTESEYQECLKLLESTLKKNATLNNNPVLYSKFCHESKSSCEQKDLLTFVEQITKYDSPQDQEKNKHIQEMILNIPANSTSLETWKAIYTTIKKKGLRKNRKLAMAAFARKALYRLGQPGAVMIRAIKSAVAVLSKILAFTIKLLAFLSPITTCFWIADFMVKVTLFVTMCFIAAIFSYQ